MHLSNLRPFIPGGADYAKSKAMFLDIGFKVNWEADELCELQMGEAKFLLQDYEQKELQENLMVYVDVDDLDAFHQHLVSLDLSSKYEGVRFSEPLDRSWGVREIHFIDIAGVCWHFA